MINRFLTLSGSFDVVSTCMFRGIGRNRPVSHCEQQPTWVSLSMVHGGVEYQRLGETTHAFNGGDADRVIGSIGIGFSY